MLTMLEMRDICKSFPGVMALQNAALSVREGEIHALLGENGAGKSTLMKILSGVHKKDSGVIRFAGREVSFTSPRQARDAGISMIHQELQLVPELTVAENIFLGREPSSALGFIRHAALRKATRALLEELHCPVSPDATVKQLSVGQQQMVEIAKALSFNAKILIMDEPTAALTEQETQRLFTLVRRLAETGVSVIYISHRMEEILALCHRATVMRDGQTIGTYDLPGTSMDTLITAMVGRELSDRYPRRVFRRGERVLSVKNLSRGNVLQDIRFDLYAGEILGIAGLMGAGRTELARALFGADRADSIEVYIDGQKRAITSPGAAIGAGIALITEDRKAQGLLLDMSVRENLVLPRTEHVHKRFILNQGEERAIAQELINQLGIRTPHTEQTVCHLSGGNQQKVVIGKWLALQPRILIMDEPTRGVDVGAKADIYRLMHAIAAANTAIIMISSELPEILGMSDRIMVMHRGRITAVLPRGEATQEKIMYYATGGIHHAS